MENDMPRLKLMDAIFLILLGLVFLIWAIGAVLCGWCGVAIGWTEYCGRMVDKVAE